MQFGKKFINSEKWNVKNLPFCKLVFVGIRLNAVLFDKEFDSLVE